jgi:hypothetical protein
VFIITYLNTKLITRPRGLHSGTKHHTTGRRLGLARLEVFIKEFFIF